MYFKVKNEPNDYCLLNFDIISVITNKLNYNKLTTLDYQILNRAPCLLYDLTVTSTDSCLNQILREL